MQPNTTNNNNRRNWKKYLNQCTVFTFSNLQSVFGSCSSRRKKRWETQNSRASWVNCCRGWGKIVNRNSLAFPLLDGGDWWWGDASIPGSRFDSHGLRQCEKSAFEVYFLILKRPSAERLLSQVQQLCVCFRGRNVNGYRRTKKQVTSTESTL